jgi:origin recognition complex subunit 3
MEAAPHDGEGAVGGVDRAFTITAGGPPALTARQRQQARAGDPPAPAAAAPWEAAARLLTLRAYPALYPGEPEDLRLRRAAAFQRCWAALEGRMQAVLEGTDAAVCASLLDLARRRHLAPPAAAALPRHGLHRVPTGLVLAGGVNSADHVATFPGLAAHLRGAGCHVALLQPACFAQGVGAALNTALRQLSGLADSQADQFAALAAWYRDEVGTGGGTVAGGGAGADVHASAPQREDGGAEDEDAGGGAEDEDAGGGADSGGDAEDEVEAGSDGAGAIAPAARRRLRSHAAAAAQQQQQQQHGPPASRPVVLVVEGAEGIDPGCLADFISTLSEGYPALPATLVLGLTTTAAALHAALPSRLLDCALDCHHFNLVGAAAPAVPCARLVRQQGRCVQRLLRVRWRAGDAAAPTAPPAAHAPPRAALLWRPLAAATPRPRLYPPSTHPTSHPPTHPPTRPRSPPPWCGWRRWCATSSWAPGRACCWTGRWWAPCGTASCCTTSARG